MVWASPPGHCEQSEAKGETEEVKKLKDTHPCLQQAGRPSLIASLSNYYPHWKYAMIVRNDREGVDCADFWISYYEEN